MSVDLTLASRSARAVARRTAAALDDRARLHARIAGAVTDWIGRNFDAEGALAVGNSAGWPPLARSTLARRRRAGQGTRPLQVTGRLRAGTRATAARDGTRIDNPVPYGRLHQEGRGVPARPFFPTRAQAGAIAARVAGDFVAEALRAGGANPEGVA